MEKRTLTNMTCEEFTKLASSEGKRDFTQRLRMLWHKIICVYCRRFVGQWRRISQLLQRDAPPATMPNAMREDLQRRLRDNR